MTKYLNQSKRQKETIDTLKNILTHRKHNSVRKKFGQEGISHRSSYIVIQGEFLTEFN